MNTRKRAVKNLVFWLLPGLAAGMLLAVVLSCHEYRTMAGIAGSVIRADPISGVALHTDKLSDAFAQSLKESTGRRSEPFGEAFLEDYGYRPMRNWGVYLPLTAMISIILFQLAGWITFRAQRQNNLQTENRILELTEYLRAVNAGEGAVLCRTEDGFSRLEDEIYKTVMELLCTKEAAVKNHEVLAERISDIAHQLKTPLTSMSLMAELLEEYQTDETQGYLSRLSGQIERLKKLVAGLLSLAKLDSHGIVFQRERIMMPELIESVQESLQEMMSRRQITFAASHCVPEDMAKAHATLLSRSAAAGEEVYKAGRETGCYIYADRQWTEEALLNILKNCVEHTPDKGRITASYSQNPIYTELRIEDGGSGFARKDLPHIFERFYRGEGAAKDNVGIGLALAKAVLEEENGNIYAENSPDGHACFRIKWYPLPADGIHSE